MVESRNRWLVVGVLAGFLVAVFAAQAAAGGVNDPTDPTTRMSHSAVVFDSALLVFREGLESILVLAAFTASFMGSNQSLRRPVGAGAAVGIAATVATWFVVIAVIGGLGLGLRYGTGTVLEGVLIAAVLIAAVGALTFIAHQRIPCKRMLVATGVLIRIVFIGMVGETVQEWQLAGWLPTTPVGVHIPGWVGTWLATFPTAEGLILQALALAFVVGSYLIAEELRDRRPMRKGARPATRLDSPPDAAAV